MGASHEVRKKIMESRNTPPHNVIVLVRVKKIKIQTLFTGSLLSYNKYYEAADDSHLRNRISIHESADSRQ